MKDVQLIMWLEYKFKTKNEFSFLPIQLFLKYETTDTKCCKDV